MISINNFAYMKIKLYIIAIQFVCVLLFAENISILNLPSSTGNHIPLNIKEYIDNANKLNLSNERDLLSYYKKTIIPFINNSKVKVYGKITGMKGLPLPDAKIVFEEIIRGHDLSDEVSRNRKIFKATSRSDGKYEIYSAPIDMSIVVLSIMSKKGIKPNYLMKVSATGYLDKEIEVLVVNGSVLYASKKMIDDILIMAKNNPDKYPPIDLEYSVDKKLTKNDLNIDIQLESQKNIEVK